MFPFEGQPKVSIYLRSKCLNRTIKRGLSEEYIILNSLEESVMTDRYNMLCFLKRGNGIQGAGRLPGLQVGKLSTV